VDVIRGDQRPSSLIVLVSKVSGFELTKRRGAMLLYLAAAHSFRYRCFPILLPRLLQSHLHAYIASLSYHGKSLTESPSYYSRLCSRYFSSTAPSFASAINSLAPDPWAFPSTTDMDHDFEAHV